MGVQDEIAHYRIVSKLGEGGMGAVYRATDTKLGRDVAVKVLPELFAADPDRLARFTREAVVLASLNHPNIATIYGVEERALVMELVEGRPIAGPLPLDTVLDYAGQIADALEYAHDKGIVHRDLKPANILVTADGNIKVLDFGLAKAMAGDTVSADPAASPTLTMRATQAGVIMGTAGYMSPEQAKGKTVDRRADIWAFGVILWELLTGKRLFEGETIAEIIAHLLTKEVDLTEVPARVRPLIQGCLEREPKQRLKSIGDWRLLLGNETPATVPTAASRRPFAMWAAFGVAMVALAFIAGNWISSRRASPTITGLYRMEITPPPDTTLYLATMNSSHALSPDGRSVAFVAESEGIRRIWIRPLDSYVARSFPGTEMAEGPFWSPDSRRLGFLTGNKIKILEIATGAVKDIYQGISTIRGAAWNEKGTIVFGPTVVGLQKISADGGEATPVITPDTSKVVSQYFPQFLPGGRQFIYWLRGTDAAQTGIYAGSLDVAPDKQDGRLILPTAGRALFSNGYLLFAKENTLFAQKFDTGRLALEGDAIAVAELNSQRDSISVSRTGMLGTAGGGLNRQVLTVVTSDGTVERTIGTPDAYVSMNVAPDGRHVALIRSEGATSNLHLWIMDLAHGVPIRFTNTGTANVQAVWSPDGREIVYSSAGVRDYKMHRKPVAGGAEQHLIPTAAGIQLVSDWSRDGSAIAYTQIDPPRLMKVMKLSLTPGATPVPLVPELGFHPMLSPDGKWVTYVGQETGSDEAYVQQVAGAFPNPAPRQRISHEGGAFPTWSEDGKKIFFNSPDSQLMVVDVTISGDRLEASHPKRLFALRATNSFNGGVFWWPMENGKKFLVLRPAPVKERENRINIMLNWTEALKAAAVE